MPMKRERYHPEWERISKAVRANAGYRCELCKAPGGNFVQRTLGGWDAASCTKSTLIVLTVHHINHDPSDNRKVNLIALCQRCHLRLDAPWRVKAKRRRSVT